MFKCRICGGTWTEIPDDAVELTHRRHGYCYRFSNGIAHVLRRIPGPPVKQEPPVEQPLVQEVIQAPVPEPIMTSVKPDEIEDELTAITTLAAAFRRVNRKN